MVIDIEAACAVHFLMIEFRTGQVHAERPAVAARSLEFSRSPFTGVGCEFVFDYGALRDFVMTDP